MNKAFIRKLSINSWRSIVLTNNEYKELVEKQFKKPLKEIMYDICINRRMEKWEGSKELGIPIKTFVYWRTKYRYGPYQYQADKLKECQAKTKHTYKTELEFTDIERNLLYKNEISLRGLKEITERILELKKLQSLDQNIDLSMEINTMHIANLESIIEHLDKYMNGSLKKQYDWELEEAVENMKKLKKV